MIAGYSSYQEHPYAQADIDHFMLKYDTNGNLLWSKSNNYHGGMITKGLDIDIQGNFYIAGAFRDSAYFDNIALKSNNFETVYMAKYNSSGSIIWAKKDGTGFDNCSSISLDNKGNFYITGNHGAQSVFSGTTLSQAGMFVIKYDTTSNGLWAKGSTANQGMSVNVDSAANCFITGVFSGSLTFNSTPQTNLFSTNPQIYVVKYDKSGNVKWAIAPASGAGTYNNGVAVCTDKKNNCYITGYFGGSTIFGNTTLSSGGTFIAKIKGSPSINTNIDRQKINLSLLNELNIYPNPVRNFVSVSYTTESEIGLLVLSVKNLTGQLIYKESFKVNANSFTRELNLEKYAKGLYFIELEPVSVFQTAANKLVKKIILD